MTVRRGSVAVKIYRQLKQNKYPTYVLAYYDGSQRKRIPFAEYEKCRAAALDIADKMAAGDLETIRLTGADRIVYIRAQEIAGRLRIPLDLALADYASAIEVLGTAGTLVQAARGFAQSAGAPVKPVRVSQAVDELLATRKTDGSSDRHVGDLKSRLKRFEKSFQCDIGNVTAAMIQDFLLHLKLAPKTTNNFRTAISNLFSFARMRGMVSKGYDPVAEVPEVKEPERDIAIWQPDEVKKLIANASPELLPYLVIAAFAGLRQSEIQRLDWTHISTTHIRVPGGPRRVKSKRLVEMQPNLRRWMTVLRKQNGPVIPLKNVSNALVNLARKAGFEPRHNALRHAFGSFRLAVAQNVSLVAEEMGNTPRMARKHYAELVTRESGEAWFSILPDLASNVLLYNAA